MANPRTGETKTKQGGYPPFFLQVVAGLWVVCEFMAFGGPFGGVRRDARVMGAALKSHAPSGSRGWIRGLPPIRDETADGAPGVRFGRGIFWIFLES